MLFNSIRTALIGLSVSAILVTSVAIVAFSLSQHENLYKEAVQRDLDGLSDNLSNDLVPLLAEDADTFTIATLLLRLDRYPDIKFAYVFSAQREVVQTYVGRAANIDGDEYLQRVAHLLQDRPSGVAQLKKDIAAHKVIGEASLPLGYLLIVHDVQGPLRASYLALASRLLPVTLVLLLFAIGLSMWAHNRLLTPLITLSRFTKDVERSKDYTKRIDLQGKHEVAILAKNINKMLQTIGVEVDKNRSKTQQLLEQKKTMERLANFDSLTGLPNRQFFMESLRLELARANRTQQDLALMFFDLDGFKAVNDSLGHETGDMLLVEVSKRVKTYLRDGDLVSRLGGDEFLILLHNDPDEMTLVAVANRIIEGLKTPFMVESFELQVGVSLGIAKAKDSEYNLSQFVSNADIAMYRSKMAGRGTFTIFAPNMMEDNKRKLLIANSIHQAIKEDEFELYYQAKVSPDETLIGFEALLRWNSDALGLVSPGEFIPIAEQSGKIVVITQWVIERLCIELPQVHAAVGAPLPVSVNLSALDLKQPNLFSQIKQLFTQYQINPEAIEFEVTESAYLENFDMANRFFKDIRAEGCSIALDDFGTGYSSLSYLTQIPINTLKIDKQFVDNIGLSDSNTLVTSTIIDMGKRLELTICAEGVETREQFDFLVRGGCHQLQGYLFSRPANLANLSTQESIERRKMDAPV